jgi:hypothetical protein
MLWVWTATLVDAWNCKPSCSTCELECWKMLLREAPRPQPQSLSPRHSVWWQRWLCGDVENLNLTPSTPLTGDIFPASPSISTKQAPMALLRTTASTALIALTCKHLSALVTTHIAYRGHHSALVDVPPKFVTMAKPSRRSYRMHAPICC